MGTADWMDMDRKTSFEWNRSISEPDLSAPFEKRGRFIIRHPHEFISIDDLKFFRRKKPPDLHTKSNICLYNKDEPVLPFAFFKTEYEAHFQKPVLEFRPPILRRATSLHLEGLMNTQSEHQSQYHPFTIADLQSSKTYPIRNPVNLQVGGEGMMSPEYRSSYISYPMVDRTMKILPREMFRVDNDGDEDDDDHHEAERKRIKQKQADAKLINASLQDTNLMKESYSTSPSEYRCKFIKFPIEKAHSIPQISHFKMQGDFKGIPEYRDSYRTYENYFKSAPIKKSDNLKVTSGKKISSTTKSEQREKFSEPYVETRSKQESLKTADHLHPRGEFTKDLPEYYESFRDPGVKEMPERGKCREPCLRLKGKLEFNPEYKSTYLDFPRSRPTVKKSTSSFRFPSSTTTSKSPTIRQKFTSTSPNRHHVEMDASLSTPCQPEYRRAQFNYQIRERTPTRKITESVTGVSSKDTQKSVAPRNDGAGKPSHKRMTSRHRQPSIIESSLNSNKPTFENIGASQARKPPKYGRRGSVLQNAAKCRHKTSIIEGNPKYAITPPPGRDSKQSNRQVPENRESFVILNEPCKSNSWMKKSWYES